MKYTYLFGLLLFLFNSQAIGDSVSVKEFNRHSPYRYSPQELKFKNSYLSDHTYRGTNKTLNYYSKVSKTDNTIENPLILVTGLEDLPENWWSTAQRALARGFKTIYIVEIRGQGHSQRVPGNTKKLSHINSFSNYINDFILFLKELKRLGEEPKAAPFIIAHSTGGLVVTSSLSRIQNEVPQFKPKKLALWTPFIRSNSSPLLDNRLTITLLSVFEKLARSFGWFIVARSFEPVNFENNQLTHDQNKFSRSEQIKYSQDLNSNGISLRWAIEVFHQAHEMLDNNYNSVQIPCLIFTAGQDDIVSNDWVINNSHINVNHLADAKHGLNIESDKILHPLLQQTLQFFLEGRQ